MATREASSVQLSVVSGSGCLLFTRGSSSSTEQPLLVLVSTPIYLFPVSRHGYDCHRQTNNTTYETNVNASITCWAWFVLLSVTCEISECKTGLLSVLLTCTARFYLMIRQQEIMTSFFLVGLHYDNLLCQWLFYFDYLLWFGLMLMFICPFAGFRILSVSLSY